jgi:hypothetical protein
MIIRKEKKPSGSLNIFKTIDIGIIFGKWNYVK